MNKINLLKVMLLELSYCFCGLFLFGFYPGSYFSPVYRVAPGYSYSNDYYILILAIIFFSILNLFNWFLRKKFTTLMMSRRTVRIINNINLIYSILISFPAIYWNY